MEKLVRFQYPLPRRSGVMASRFPFKEEIACSSHVYAAIIIVEQCYNKRVSIRDSREAYNKYMREYHLKLYHERRNEAIDKLGGKCRLCGGIEDLQFDHIKREDKRFDISKYLLRVSRVKYERELMKCQLLCSGCHVEKTLVERGQKPARGTHGTLSSYRYCHCELCKKTKREWQRKYRKTHKRITVDGKRVTVER